MSNDGRGKTFGSRLLGDPDAEILVAVTRLGVSFYLYLHSCSWINSCSCRCWGILDIFSLLNAVSFFFLLCTELVFPEFSGMLCGVGRELPAVFKDLIFSSNPYFSALGKCSSSSICWILEFLSISLQFSSSAAHLLFRCLEVSRVRFSSDGVIAACVRCIVF